jgi:hypothetical protein
VNFAKGPLKFRLSSLRLLPIEILLAAKAHGINGL